MRFANQHLVDGILEDIEKNIKDMGGKAALNTNTIRGIYEEQADSWKTLPTVSAMIMEKAPKKSQTRGGKRRRGRKSRRNTRR